MNKAMKAGVQRDKGTKQIFEKADELADYKKKLDNLNNKSDDMFEHMK
jgi:hypothetical protein